MRVPQFWAGMGRAVNNLCAILIGSFSVALIRSGDSTKIMIASIGLFVLISIAIYIYTVMGQTDVELPDIFRGQCYIDIFHRSTKKQIQIQGLA